MLVRCCYLHTEPGSLLPYFHFYLHSKNDFIEAAVLLSALDLILWLQRPSCFQVTMGDKDVEFFSFRIWDIWKREGRGKFNTIYIHVLLKQNHRKQAENQWSGPLKLLCLPSTDCSFRLYLPLVSTSSSWQWIPVPHDLFLSTTTCSRVVGTSMNSCI